MMPTDVRPHEFTQMYGDFTPDPHDLETPVMTFSFSASGAPDYVVEQVGNQLAAQAGTATSNAVTAAMAKERVCEAIRAYVKEETRGRAYVAVSGSFYITVTRSE